MRPTTLAAALVLPFALTLASAPLPATARPALPPAAKLGTQQITPIQILFGRLRGGRCLAPQAVPDGDVRRNSGVLATQSLCVTQDRFRDEGITWTFTSIANRRAPRGPVWYLPHDNEQTAFDAALHAVARYGGRMVAVESNESRNHAGRDPNRLFARTRQQAAACGLPEPMRRYTDEVMGLFRGASRVLTIHNNQRGGAISANLANAKSRGFRARGRFGDPNHLVFIAGPRPIDGDRRALVQRDRLLAAGLNVVHETVTAANNDCSLSNYVVLNDGRPYYNLEATHGSPLQRPMVDALLAALGYRPR